MKSTHLRFVPLFALWLSTSVLGACGGTPPEAKTPTPKSSADSEDYSDDEVRDSPDWR